MPTTISWVRNPDGTDGETWNPVVGCTNTCPWCYARQLHTQRHAAGMKGYERPFNEPTPMPARLAQPLSWRKPRGIFVCSMGDIFDQAIPNEYIAAVFGVMSATPWHRYYLLTKRPERMGEWFGWLAARATTGTEYHPCSLEVASLLLDHERDNHPDGDSGPIHCKWGPNPDASWPLPNVWLGVSVTNQSNADERIPVLLRTPAAHRFVSYEPALGGIDFQAVPLPDGDTLGEDLHSDCDQAGLDWLIMGGATGPHATPMHSGWARSTRDQCKVAGVPFHFKGWGEWVPAPVAADILSATDKHVPGGWGEWCFDGDDRLLMVRVGRTASGHLLDGVEHRETP